MRILFEINFIFILRSEIKEHIVCNGLNEVFSEWVSACPSKCPTTGIQRPTPPPPQTCMAIVHNPSCICTNGTIRDTLNNKCVKSEDCPKIP